MKRNVLALVLILSAAFGVCERAYGQASSPIDLVLLLDTSSNMSSSYDNVNNYITGAFLNEFLRVGDTFHLIAFSGSPRLDVARRISGVGDVETIIGRMMLQYPVERGNNIGAALTYAEQYILSLPGRPKKIVLVSVGGSDTNNLVSGARQRLNSRNTTLDYIQVTPGQPLTNLPSSGRPAPVRQAGAAQTSRPGIDDSIGMIDTPTTHRPPSTGPADDWRVGDPAASEDPGTGPAGATRHPDQDDLTEGSQGTVTGNEAERDPTFTHQSADRDRKDAGESWASSLPIIIGIIIGILLLLGLILLLSSRKLGSSPNRVMAEVASSGSRTGGAGAGSGAKEERFADHSKDLKGYQAGSTRRSTPYDDRNSKTIKNAQPVINPSGPLLLNLFVEDQNTAIGKRNIHSLKSGYSLSVGGGKRDDYYVFLVPLPSNIGEIRRNGSSLSFIPKKGKYFPDGSGEIRDCINKTIRIVSDKNYEVRFRFEMYEDPLLALNRLLHSVKVPG